MDAKRQARAERKKELLRELAELEIEELRAEGVFLGTPHYGVLERAASALGRELSCQAQQRAVREVRAECAEQADCPTCGTRCRVGTKTRDVTSIDGPVRLDEATAYCEKCRRSFFPSAGGAGAGWPRSDSGTDAGRGSPGGRGAFV